MKKGLFIVIGILSVLLGVVGIFIPGLPTTPFLLLSSWLFYRSSDRLHDRLHRSRLGKYIRRYESREGVSALSKVCSLACMWGMICLSAFAVFDHLHLRLLLFALGAAGSYCILWLVPTQKREVTPPR